MTVIAFSSVIGPVPITCVISERHTASIEITGNPIETGAEVNDHAYVKPKEVVLEIADDFAAMTFQALVRFQESRVPFVLVTGLSVYKDMLIQSIDATRDKMTSRILSATVTLREVIIVSTASVSVSGQQSSDTSNARPGSAKSTRASTPSKTGANNSATADRASGTVQRGDNPTTPVGADRNQSILSRAFQ